MAQTMRRRRPRLAQALVEQFRHKIENGDLPVGAKLPTEPQLEAQFSVSRTVVREAIAELRSAGLVTPVQGKGMFVSEDLPHTGIILTPIEIQSIPQTLEMLEFRIAIETEAAAVAAYRRSAKQEDAIRNANQEMERLIEADAPTVAADLAFHMAISEATNNLYFADALKQFGQRAIPRSQFPTLPSATDRQYLLGVLNEHQVIVDAIADQDPEAARQAMRDHLIGSQKRYRRLSR